LTALQRRLLESVPLFAFDAPTQRSGKSLLAESLGIFATGRKPAAVGVPREGDEFRKAITSALRENQAQVNLDNITRPLDSSDLARALTQSEYADRLLGANRMLRLPTNILWTATGDNLMFHGDLPSRTLISRIDPQVERPEDRHFAIADLPAHLREHRKRLVAAALTVVRAFHVAGRPRQNVKPWGGFDQWSREIREPLVWLGLADPCASREQIVANDPDRELTAEVFRAWHAAFGEQALLAREVIAAAGDGAYEELRQALLVIAARRDDSQKIDALRLGHWLKSKKDRVVDGLRLTPDQPIRGTQVWRVKVAGIAGSEGIKPAGQETPTHTHSAPTDITDTKNVCHPLLDRRVDNSPNSSNSPADPADDDIELCVHGEDSVECDRCREDVDVDWEELS
jgi:putative DNA primase/helicase